MKKLTADINLDDEVAHLVAFIDQTWTPIANLEALFTEIRDAALHAGRTHFDTHDAWLVVTALEKQRTALLTQTLGPKANADLYDALCTLFFALRSELTELFENARDVDGEWNFARRVEALEGGFTSRYPDLAAARPKGWDALAEGYQEFDGQEEYDPHPDRELFKGADLEGRTTCDFTGRVALPYVLHQEVCQRYRASYQLIGAVFAHFMRIAEFLNMQRLVRDIENAFPQREEAKLLFERVVTTENPMLKLAVDLVRAAPPREDYEAALASQAAFDALPEAEKARIQEENVKELTNMLNDWDDAGDAAQVAAGKQRRMALLQAAFGSQA